MVQEAVSKGLYRDLFRIIRNYWLVFFALVGGYFINYRINEFTQDVPTYVLFLPRLILFSMLEYPVCAIAVNQHAPDKSLGGSLKGFVFRCAVMSTLGFLVFYAPAAVLSEAFYAAVTEDFIVSEGYGLLVNLFFLAVLGTFLPEYLKTGISNPIAVLTSAYRHFPKLAVMFLKGPLLLTFLTFVVFIVWIVLFTTFSESPLMAVLVGFRLADVVFCAADAAQTIMFYIIAARLYWLCKGETRLAEIFD